MYRSVSFAPGLHGEVNDDDDDEEELEEDNNNHNKATQHSQAPPQAPAVGLGGAPSAAVASNNGSGVICPNCGGREIENQDASGASVCVDCGAAVEENAIVSAVEFVEGAGGASTMVGQFVSANSSKAYISSGHPSHRGGRARDFGISRPSRETTLANGRRRIQEIASRLRLGGSYYVDAAHRLFTIAVEKNFVQGRRTTHVVATCLYIVCRQEKSQHMLIDFSDALQVNVYTLGTCFLKFRRLLGLKLEIIDPALYVYRFAAHLELDEKANAVSLTALRLVARMKRDWIVAGRRPAGICAAALLIAARAHGFSKHHQDVTRILRVCGMTVTSRVREFELTQSAALTLDQFHQVDLEAEADPPAFTRNKIREARVKAIQEGNTALLTSGALDDPREGKRKAAMYRTPNAKESERQTQLKKMYSALEEELTGGSSNNQKEAGASDSNNEGNDEGGETGDQTNAEGSEAAEVAMNGEQNQQKEAEDGKPPARDEQADAMVPSQNSGAKSGLPKSLEQAHPRNAKGKLLVLADQATQEEMQEPVGFVEAKLSLSEWKQNMPEGMEDEFDDIFRSEEEEMQKEAIFNKINKDYLEQKERKDNLKRNEETATSDKDKDLAAQAEGHARYTKSARSRKRRHGGDEDGDGDDVGTTEEQLRAAVANRKISRKINYDALSSIFDDDGSLGNVTNERGGGDDTMFDF